jgi:hypothetical protein
MKKSTSDLFVSHCYDNSEIGEIFTTKKEAEKANGKNNDHYENVLIPMMGSLVTDRTPRRPYKVMTLWDAIEEIKDRVKENTEFSIRNGELY